MRSLDDVESGITAERIGRCGGQAGNRNLILVFQAVCGVVSHPSVIVGFSIPVSSLTCQMRLPRKAGVETVNPTPGCSGIARLTAVGYYSP